jgi:hypothetical protein
VDGESSERPCTVTSRPDMMKVCEEMVGCGEVCVFSRGLVVAAIVGYVVR